MTRALAVAVLAALFLSGTAAAADPPIVSGSAIGGDSPIRVSTTVTPPVHSFGNAVTAVVSVFADTKWVDPSRVRLASDFSPYTPVGPAIEHRSEHGRIFVLTSTWTLRCLTLACVPIVPPSDIDHVFHVRPVSVSVLGANGKVAYSLSAAFPAITVFSQISPEIIVDLEIHNRLDWQWDLATPAPSYRVAPDLVFWLALALAGLCAAAGVALVARWLARFRKPSETAVAGAVPSSSLERALALFFWAGGHGDETLQRKSLERVAAELPFDVADLSEVTREIAWSPETPGDDEVAALSEKAGILAQPRHEPDE